MQHIPVLREEVQKYLELKNGDVVIDATLGLGGHALDILEKIGKKGKLIAFEQDERNLDQAKRRLEACNSQIVYFHDNFRNLKTRTKSLSTVDAVLFDLGLSSPHVDDPVRGFSFMKNGPLDMRFDQRTRLTAEEILDNYPQEELARIFWEYGEEKMSRIIARKICEARKNYKFERTGQLVELIESILPVWKFKHHPAARVFQALRIEVNDELDALKEGLNGAFEILKSGGRLVVISYHSLEDRIVKDFFNDLRQPPAKKEYLMYREHGDPLIEVLTKKPVVPGDKEIAENPRSRSAKLRACKKL
ncbi:16S rRNA (cytosine(1402)-N(4))-methyltransferase RsmH [Candidatus Peregrinibacteria bacterium]|nr:16S rRNA (cytosine(1402)-N(4))-methyltransferase RsmH [Candidatus Peregrinibacteria bacterium]